MQKRDENLKLNNKRKPNVIRLDACYATHHYLICLRRNQQAAVIIMTKRNQYNNREGSRNQTSLHPVSIYLETVLLQNQ